MGNIVHFSLSQILQYGAGLGLEAGLCLLAVRRGLQQRLRLFTIYLIAVFACDVIRWLPIIFFGLSSPQTLWTYWSAQLLLVLLRGAAVFELARYVLKAYAGIWAFCRTLLALIGIALSATAVLSGWQRSSYILRVIVAADRGLELAILGILLFAFAFCRYYRIPVRRWCALIALGIGFYSAIQVANNTFVSQWLRYYPMWTIVRQNSFAVSIILWAVALWPKLPERSPEVSLLAANVYPQVGSALNIRLRELNSRLEDILK